MLAHTPAQKHSSTHACVHINMHTACFGRTPNPGKGEPLFLCMNHLWLSNKSHTSFLYCNAVWLRWICISILSFNQAGQ